MIYMVCYDVSHHKRLHKLARKLEQYGIRVQKSFFQCEMEDDKMESMKRELLNIISRKHDSLFIYPLCQKCSREALTDGSGELIRISTYEIL